MLGLVPILLGELFTIDTNSECSQTDLVDSDLGVSRGLQTAVPLNPTQGMYKPKLWPQADLFFGTAVPSLETRLTERMDYLETLLGESAEKHAQAGPRIQQQHIAALSWFLQ